MLAPLSSLGFGVGGQPYSNFLASTVVPEKGVPLKPRWGLSFNGHNAGLDVTLRL